MRLLTLSFAVALAQLSALITAIPVAKSADAERSETEINALVSPIVDAPYVTGRFAPASSPHRLAPRVVLPGPVGSHTQVILAGGAATNALVAGLLSDAYETVLMTLSTWGDRLISHGMYQYLEPNGLAVQVSNANNHQVTYGVLAAALKILKEYMAEHGGGEGIFIIRDGGREVGQGRIFQQ